MQVSENRWLNPERYTVALPTTTIGPSEVDRPTGPTGTQRGIARPDQADRLPHRDFGATTANYWWLGVHGGAGESSLARLDKNTLAAEHHWPHTTIESIVVLVARSNMQGLRAAQRAATEWASGSLPNIQVAGLVVIADAPGRPPKEIRDFTHIVGGGVPHMWHVPWIEAWRLGHEVPYEKLPKDLRTVLKQVRIAATSATTGPPAN